MRSWDCYIEIVRNTVLEAEDEDQACGLALDWFFNDCIHAIGRDDVSAHPACGGAA